MAEDKIFETQDGSHSILSYKYGVSYHSKYGAIQESLHVFLKSALHEVALNKKAIRILEIGFGTGLNALLTFAKAQQHDLNIYYEAIEAYPITVEQAKELNFATLLEEPMLQDFFLEMHKSPWDEIVQLYENFQLKKVNSLFENVSYKGGFDIIYFDAFAPSAQPELWEESILQAMYDALDENGIFVTYCAKGIVKRRLKAVGFSVESLPGPPGKREMTRGRK
ncbi:MAG: tRNA (5-methylaminomethyl-2-thiouridine)(34)-methyltransferase MnmD [Bacteroidota bacterium]